MKLGTILERLRIYSAPFLLLLSIALSVLWKKNIHIANIDITMLRITMLSSSFLLVLLLWRRGKWWEKWRRTLPSLAFVVLPILGYTEIISASGSNGDLTKLLLGPLTSIGTLAIVLVTVTTFAVNISLLSANVSAATVGPVAVAALTAIGIKPSLLLQVC